ncbi:hypothetical protein [Candidatus Harpocratesius sp.]
MKHVWIVKKDSSTMLFYHSYNNIPFKAILVSGLLSAMNSFSEIEIQKRGIQSINMHDLKWVYFNDPEHNLLLIGADSRKSNANVMRARLSVIDTIFIQKYQISPKFWDQTAIDLDLFIDFAEVLDELSIEWKIADKSLDLGKILDLLRIFQKCILKICNFIETHIHGKKYRRLLFDLHSNSPRLKERYGNYVNTRAFEVLELFIPKINLSEEKIIFNSSLGHNIIQSNPKIGLEESLLKAVYYMIFQQFIQSIKEILTNPEEKLTWFQFLQEEIMPFLLRKWDYLSDLGVLRDLLKIFYSNILED